jgi:uncharacterized protein YbaP (TraB family)
MSSRSPAARTRRIAWPATLALVAFVAAAAPAAPRGAAKNFIWRATRGGAVVYLVGSVHILPADAYPLDATFEDSFKASNVLVEEVDLGEMLNPAAQMQMLQRGMLPAGQTLEGVVSPQTMALVTKATSSLGPATEMLKRFKPWMLAIALEGLELQRAGFDPELGVDKHFYDAAQTAGKTVQGLETVDFQISRFDDMTKEQQDHFLADTLKELETETASVTRLISAWKNGDAPTLERLMLKDLQDDQMMYQRLLVERNRNWMPKIEALFASPGRAFVVVGAAHLLGPDGLLQMLKARGYAVEQM